MRYKQLGATGYEVSQLALGTWAMGGLGWGETNEQDCLAAIDAMLGSGVNLIDTAPAYNAGEAEKLLGRALRGRRDKVYVATKVGTWFIDGRYVKTLQSDKLAGQCEESLRNLQTDYIDLYLVHWPDPAVPIAETMEVLGGLKRQGKIRHIGLSNFSGEQLEEACRHADIAVFQPQYSMVNRSAEALIRWAHGRGIGTMTYGSLGSGILTGAIRAIPDLPETDNRRRFYHYFEEPAFSQIMALLDTMDAVSARRGNVPLAQIALNWCTQKDFITSAIVGVRNRREAEQNCAAMDWALTGEELELIDKTIRQVLG